MRSEQEIPEDMRNKISLFCNVRTKDVIQNLTAPSLYEVPLMLEKEGFADIVCEQLGLENRTPELTEWMDMVNSLKNATKKVTIGLVGKYVALPDAYLSVAEALRHAGFANSANVDIKWVHSEDITRETAESMLSDCDGILVPGGFGDRGIEGKIEAIRYARENKIPFFGICLGMQMAVAEFARHVAGMPTANSSEFGEDKYPVIDIMEDQKDVTEKGGTMRLGLYPCKLTDGTKAKEIYGEDLIYERHRHRYEFNNSFRKQLEEVGMVLAGLSPDQNLVEIVEIKDHPWFIGVQFHPEFKSRPNRPHKLFKDFIRASIENKK